MLSRLALVATVLALLPLAAQTPQAPKPKRKARAVKPAAAATTAPPANLEPAPGVTVLRTADCVLGVKGELVRDLTVHGLLGSHGGDEEAAVADPQAVAAASKKHLVGQHSVDRFDFEIPGTLIEETDAKGTGVRFRFVPAVDMAAAKAQGQLRHEERLLSGGAAARVVEAHELTGGTVFVFEAAARGGQIIPVSGAVYLRGTVQGEAAPVGTLSMKLPQRPIVSAPLPSQRMSPDKDLTPPLRFTGISLWAWPNSKGAFTVAATADYSGPGPHGTVTGSVQVSFRVGETK